MPGGYHVQMRQMQTADQKAVDHNDFNANLALAKEGERQVAAKIESAFRNLKVISCCNSDGRFDLVTRCRLTGKLITFEVKEDRRVQDTGNIVIEFESWGRASGLQTSQADYWVFRLWKDNVPYDVVIARLVLLALVYRKRYWKIEQMQHTDSRNKLLFFKLAELKRYCLKI